MAIVVAGGWKPPGCGDDENIEVNLLSELVDVDDPAFPEIMQVVLELRALELDLTEELVRHAIKLGRKRCMVADQYWKRIRERHPLSHKTIDAAEKSLVYYMRIGNRVKIGVTTNLAERMKSIHPEELMAIEPGGYDLEQERHSQFCQLRSHGEWFRLEEPLAGHIERLQGCSVAS